jgi:membrane protease YdiL (CAAX protease family)
VVYLSGLFLKGERMEKPVQVIKATYLLWLSLALNFAIVSAGIEHIQPVSSLLIATFFLSLGFGIAALLVREISKGRDWARILFGFLFFFVLSWTARIFLTMFHFSIIGSSFWLFLCVTQGAALCFLYTKPSSAWFKEKEKFFPASVIAKEPTETTTSFKHSGFLEILTVYSVAIGVNKILVGALPDILLVNYSTPLFVNLAATFFLVLKYSSMPISVKGLGRAVRYGITVGSILAIAMFLVYAGGLIKRPDDYVAFINQSVFHKCLLVIIIIAAAPIVEEALFRGCFYRILRTQYGVFWAAILSNLLFLGVHQASVATAVNIFIKGMLFTYAYHKSRSVWGSIIAHSMNNLSGILFQYFV